MSKRISPELLKRATGATDGELRIILRNPHAAYDSRTHLLDSAAAQAILQGIREARREP